MRPGGVIQVGDHQATLEDLPVVILTTIGTKSRKVRREPHHPHRGQRHLGCRRVSSGGTQEPSWYRNLIAHQTSSYETAPICSIFEHASQFGAKRQRWWQVAERFSPRFPEFRRAAGREIPLVLVKPTAC